MLFFIVMVISTLHAYTQAGGVKLNTPEAVNGYVLLKQVDFDTYYLINNCGEIVNSWNIEDAFFNHAKLLPNGNLLYFDENNIQERDWNNEIVNSIFLNSSDIMIDYEVIKMNNGNYLSVGRKRKSTEEFIDLGFSLSIQSPFVVDVVMEIDYNSGDILWEWDISDHIIQERDPSAGNYGVVADHPELLNVDAISDFDWTIYESFMINGMDFNEELEQIALSIRKLSEVIIIDKSTTTEEAATGEGGNSGKGGDVLFRWGNPENYGQGAGTNARKLYFQHNPKWATTGPYEGKLTAFNNGLNRPFSGAPFSEAPVIDTGVDENGNYFIDGNDQFASGSPAFIYRSATVQDNFFSGYLSGAQLLSNGNAFITVGEVGELKEFDINGNLVWEFRYASGETPFRTEKYTEDFPGFVGLDLSPKGFLPGSDAFDGCVLTSIDELNSNLLNIGIAQEGLNSYKVLNPERLNLETQILDMSAHLLSRFTSNQSNLNLNLNGHVPGMYVLSVKDLTTGSFRNFKLIVTH